MYIYIYIYIHVNKKKQTNTDNLFEGLLTWIVHVLYELVCLYRYHNLF